MSSSDWTDDENDLIVADYFSMLSDELAGHPYNKAEHNRRLQPLLPTRSHKSLEFKHQNISAVLLGLGQPWIDGYKPARRFQLSLVDAVLRWLDANPLWAATAHTWRHANADAGAREAEPLWIGPSPVHSNQPSPIDADQMAHVARKYDVAERDARNRALGKAGEQRVIEHEKTVLRMAGRHELAEKVRWTAAEDGDGAGFDILSYETDGRPRLLEVKTTNGWERTPFHISRNELAVAETNRDIWHLIRVWNFAREPKAYSLRPPLEAHVSLTPTSFLASLH
jgi:hypothetical protein